MSPETTLAPDADLAGFLAGVAAHERPAMRSLALAWQAAGGQIHLGRHVVRLLANHAGRLFTAGTLHAQPARLELAHALLATHGLDAPRWQAWNDERPELATHGFDAAAKFPSVELARLPEGARMRLALGLRDLAKLLES
ncbi:MAG: hypothetical protein ACYDBQ_04215 [Thermoplasmatota archaeon]